MRMRIAAGAALFGLIAAGPALAADLPLKASPVPVAIPSWDGPYVGLGLGARTTVVDASVASAILNTQAGSGLPPQEDLLGPLFCGTPCANGQSLNSTAFRAAPYVGYNWQLGTRWLAGFEADWGWANGSNTFNGGAYPGSAAFFTVGTYGVKSTWDASVRARLGVLVTPDVLLYTTGGAAWLHVAQTSNCPADTIASGCQTVLPTVGALGPAVITDETTRLGWTIGGGVEALLGSHWLARGEYRYADFGTWSPTDARACAPLNSGACFVFAAASTSVTDAVRLRTHTATIGLAYKFGGP